MPSKVVVITGANSGIGFATAVSLAKPGNTIVTLCRRKEEGEKTMAELKKINSSITTENFIVDLSDLQSVRNTAKEVLMHYPVIDRLINNAGYYPNDIQYIGEIEKSFVASHLGHMLLTLSLLPALEKSSESRVINLSSMLHSEGRMKRFFVRVPGYTSSQAYADAKLANLLFTMALATELPDNVTTYSVHPGMVGTNFAKGKSNDFLSIFFSLFRGLLASPEKGAATSVYLAEERIEDIKPSSGGYFASQKLVAAKNKDITSSHAQILWNKSMEVLKPYLT
jgi:retinol dehydrogenase-12